MNANKDDAFLWRKEGKRFEIGGEDDVGISAMMAVDNSMLFVTRKSIYMVQLADSIDPNRTNASIPDVKQKILSYGSDDYLVGRTLLQANILFQPHCLGSQIECPSAVNIALSFLKEITSLHELATAYISDESTKNSLFTGGTGDDLSLSLPSIDKVEQKVKQFVINADHAVRHLIELTQLFYPEIKNESWSKALMEKLKREKGEDAPATLFVAEINPTMWLARNLRNAVEHPKQDDRVKTENYRLTESGKVKIPSIQYVHMETPLSEMPVSQFMSLTVENLLTSFEELMAHLCNIHAAPFGGDKRSVVEMPEANRNPSEAHVRFGYQIDWTK